MCNGHRFVKSTLLQSPGYLADLSPYITAVISSRLLATPIQLTANAIKPLAPLAQSLLPTRASNFILSNTLTCEYCLHQVSQDAFDDGRICPFLLMERLGMPDNSEFVMADLLIEAQDRRRVQREQAPLKETTNSEDNNERDLNRSGTSRGTTSSSNCQNDITTDSDSSRDVSSQNLSSRIVVAEEKGNKISDKTPSSRESHMYKEEILIMQICPEIGLHAQAFACVDCDKEIDLSSARLCHYDGRYYCHQCHTGSDLMPIPSRVLRNWDFTPKPVSKSSAQKICFLRTKPVLFNLFQFNSMLYGFIERLVEIKQIRERIRSMLKYLEVCGQPNKPYLIPVPKHFLNGELLNFFTLNDLYDINYVHDFLERLQSTMETHITRDCESCRGKGFYCELCKDLQDILYPFSRNGIACSKCHTVYHKNCFQRKKKNCPKCARLISKKQQASGGALEVEPTGGGSITTNGAI